MPFFSIITPVFNGESFVHEYVSRLKSQNYSDWESVVVDDNSTDATVQILHELTSHDDRFRIFNHETHLKLIDGPYQARNVGIKQSLGSYICFLDIDDFWPEHKLQIYRQVILDNSNVKVVFSNYIKFSVNSKGGMNSSFKPVVIPHLLPFPVITLFANPIPMLTACVSKIALDTIDFKPIRHEDYLFWQQLFSTYTSMDFVHINEFLGYYRVHSNSLTGKRFQSLIWNLDVYEYNGHSKCISVILLFLKLCWNFALSVNSLRYRFFNKTFVN